jgi:SAM-dependent methyltransferase
MSGFAAVPVRRVVEFWDRRPCNSRHSPKPIGSRGYFDDVQTRRYFVEPHISGFADFERWRGKPVLEIGCGIGTDTINFARHGADVITAVNVSERSLELAKRVPPPLFRWLERRFGLHVCVTVEAV